MNAQSFQVHEYQENAYSLEFGHYAPKFPMMLIARMWFSITNLK